MTLPWFSNRWNGSVNVTKPRSYSTLVKNREYKRCRIACSIPPVYWSAGIHRSTASWSNALSGSSLQYRRKYQEESTNVSMVSVSRRAAPPHFGHVVFTNPSCFASGDSPCGEKSTSSGSSTGSSSSGTGTSPHDGQCTIGIGHPQYRCRDISQSRRRNDTACFPRACSSSHDVTRSTDPRVGVP